MMRPILVAMAMLALSGSAGAQNPTFLQVTVGPTALNDPTPCVTFNTSPCPYYYVRASLALPDAPGSDPQSPSTDCAEGDHPADTVDAVARVAGPIDQTLEEGLADLGSFHVGGLVPTCIAGPSPCVGVPLNPCVPYVAYNVTSGGYCIDDPTCGYLGFGLDADCEGCPFPP